MYYIVGAGVLLVVGLFIVMLPDLIRYLKIRSM